MEICTKNDHENFARCHGRLTNYTYNVAPIKLSTEHYYN